VDEQSRDLRGWIVARDADVIIAGARKSNKFQADGRSPGLRGLANPKPWRFIEGSRGSNGIPDV